MNILLIRHGQIQGNQEFRFHGSSDIGLSVRGKFQAELTAAWLVKQHIAALYSSDLARARETALICSAGLNMPVRYDAGLREIDVGTWTGCTLDQVKAGFAEDFAAWQDDRVYYRRGGGESFIDVEQRVVATVQSLYHAHQNDTIALVCHSGTIRAALTGLKLYNHQDIFAVEIPHCSITLLTLEGDTCVVAALTDVTHLASDHDRFQHIQRLVRLRESRSSE